MNAGAVGIECPCGVVIDVPINVELSPVHAIGEQRLICTPDMADLWAHYFSHPIPPGDGLRIAA